MMITGSVSLSSAKDSAKEPSVSSTSTIVNLPSQPRKILLIRLSAIGDVAFSTAFLQVLHAEYPQACIDFAVSEPAADLLLGHAHIHQIHIVPIGKLKQLFKAKQIMAAFTLLKNIRSKLQAEQYDLVIDAQGILKSALVAWFTAAPLRISFGGKEGAKWLVHHVIARDNPTHTVAGDYRYLAESLGLPVATFAMRLPMPDNSTHLISQLVGSVDYIAIAPFTTRPQKHWQERNWLPLMQLLADGGIGTLVILGGPGDAPQANQLFSYSQIGLMRVVNLVGKTSLSQASAILSQAKVTIGVDTGITHIAYAQGSPVVALFGSTSPYQSASQLTVLYSARNCSPCHRSPTCNNRYDCMADITPQRVVDTALQLINQTKTLATSGVHSSAGQLTKRTLSEG